MRLFIQHRTRYRYEQAPRAIIETLHLTPSACDIQSTSDWHIELSVDALLSRSTDAFGNIVHTFSLERPGQDIEIIACGTVETDGHNGVVSGANEPLPLPVFLRPTDRTRADNAIASAVVAAQASSDGTLLSAAHKWNKAVHDAIQFELDATDAGTLAAEAFSAGSGVCQDLAHVFIAGARHLGIPARYISGYQYSDGGSRDDQAGHAWAEVFIKGLGWVSFDPTAGRSTDETYVRVAVGLDAVGAAPVRGAAYGGIGEQLSVEVSVARAHRRAMARTMHPKSMSRGLSDAASTMTVGGR
ncbi:MAG: transglutaminase family protein [Pseudomonadota bacterium]